MSAPVLIRGLASKLGSKKGLEVIPGTTVMNRGRGFGLKEQGTGRMATTGQRAENVTSGRNRALAITGASGATATPIIHSNMNTTEEPERPVLKLKFTRDQIRKRQEDRQASRVEKADEAVATNDAINMGTQENQLVQLGGGTAGGAILGDWASQALLGRNPWLRGLGALVAGGYGYSKAAPTVGEIWNNLGTTTKPFPTDEEKRAGLEHQNELLQLNPLQAQAELDARQQSVIDNSWINLPEGITPEWMKSPGGLPPGVYDQADLNTNRILEDTVQAQKDEEARRYDEINTMNDNPLTFGGPNMQSEIVNYPGDFVDSRSTGVTPLVPIP